METLPPERPLVPCAGLGGGRLGREVCTMSPGRGARADTVSRAPVPVPHFCPGPWPLQAPAPGPGPPPGGPAHTDEWAMQRQGSCPRAGGSRRFRLQEEGGCRAPWASRLSRGDDSADGGYPGSGRKLDLCCVVCGAVRRRQSYRGLEGGLGPVLLGLTPAQRQVRGAVFSLPRNV